MNEPTKKPLRKPSALLVRGVDRDVHVLFKAECARRGRTMRGALLAFMKDTKDRKVINLARLLNEYPDPK